MSTNNNDNPQERRSRLLHERAESILASALTAQGRIPTAYTAGEYLIALNKADDELQHTAIEQTIKAAAQEKPAEGIAERAGDRLWLLDGNLLDDDEFQVEIERRYAKDAERARLDRELGLS